MKRALILIFVFNSIIGFAQEKDPFSALKSMSYFDAYNFLQENETQFIDSDSESIYWQAKGSLYSFLGKYEKAISTYNNRYDKSGLYIKDINLSNKKSSQTELDSLYNSFDVVLFNEAHHISQHRAFLYSQLSTLKTAGYKFLALEALNSGVYIDSTSASRGYPIFKKTGIYINDPVYGLLIRHALDLGFTLIPYESYGKNRELDQANNIYNSYKSEKGKLIVYAGYGHICESAENPFMARYLKEKLGEDLLTITQTLPNKFKPITNKSDSCEFYLLERSNACYDYTVIPNFGKRKSNIPSWYALLNCKYKPLRNFHHKKIQIPCLIQLYNNNETENSVPIYQFIIENEDDVDMLLPYTHSGNYRLVVQNKNGITVKNIEL